MGTEFEKQVDSALVESLWPETGKALIPLGGRVLVKRLDDLPEKTPGGIIIPDTARERPTIGTVLAISPEIEGIAVGDVIYFGAFAGAEINVDGDELLVLHQSDIIAKRG